MLNIAANRRTHNVWKVRDSSIIAQKIERNARMGGGTAHASQVAGTERMTGRGPRGQRRDGGLRSWLPVHAALTGRATPRTLASRTRRVTFRTRCRPRDPTRPTLHPGSRRGRRAGTRDPQPNLLRRSPRSTRSRSYACRSPPHPPCSPRRRRTPRSVEAPRIVVGAASVIVGGGSSWVCAPLTDDMAQPREWTTAGTARSGRVPCCACAPLLWRGTGRGKPGVVAAAVLCRCERCQLLAHTSVGPVVVAGRPRQKPATPAFLFFNLPASHTGLFVFQSSGEPCPTENLASSWVGTSCRVACALIPPPKRPPAYSTCCCCSPAVLMN